MTRRLLALLCALVLFAPSAASAAQFVAIYPGDANFVASILTSSSLNGVHHQHLGVNLGNLDLFAVLMNSSGTPNAPTGRPWLYGRIALIEQLDANTFRVTWNVGTSANGITFSPAGTISILVNA